MAAESSAKAAPRTAPSDLVFNGLNPLNPKPTPPSFSPNSTAALDSSTSSMPPQLISILFYVLMRRNFRSLLYEACGRIINPVHGSVGLMCSGNWPRCHAAVEAVLQGTHLVMQLPGEDDSAAHPQGCDIRHLSKDSSTSLRRIRTRNRFKRIAAHAKTQVDSIAADLVMTLANRNEQPFRGVKPEELTSEIGLDLTLGMNPGLQAYMSRVIEISDSET
ncbi:UNVERIFIED_CONTAM: LOB domain-containing protein 42 [Sesamum radiatum]|uniref:LOB domain-containing protein 42 n=1 Tax=Sesamum radiatum TaxID=300843 RepID=A0AAW2VAQ9_SESRA